MHSITRVEFSCMKVDVECPLNPLNADSSEADDLVEFGPRFPKCRADTKLSLSILTDRAKTSLSGSFGDDDPPSSTPSWFTDLERVFEKRRRIEVKISPLLVLRRPLSKIFVR